MKNPGLTIWMARFPIFLVFAFNIQCAAAFLFFPAQYAPSFELNGNTGRWVIQALGILFIMWNVPYFFALFNPVKNFISLAEAVLMQLIAGLSESILYLTIDQYHMTIRNSIVRFMLFDWGGLVLLVISLVLAGNLRRVRSANNKING